MKMMDIMIKKKIYTWQDIERMCVGILNQMYKDNWKPDYIVGITRGGNVPATIMSNILDVPCEALKVSLRDDSRLQDDFWLKEHITDKNILIVDDINDTGATFKWIWDNWQLSLQEHNVKFATLTENLPSIFGQVSYYCHEVNKTEEDVWLVYPWENVCEYHA